MSSILVDHVIQIIILNQVFICHWTVLEQVPYSLIVDELVLATEHHHKGYFQVLRLNRLLPELSIYQGEFINEACQQVVYAFLTFK